MTTVDIVPPMRYRYVGPAELRALPPTQDIADIRSPEDLEAWLENRDPHEPATFVVTLGGVLRLAPRRSEHVACARGEDVLAAGEISFARSGSSAGFAHSGRSRRSARSGHDWVVLSVTNQSTGYCPDPDSWPAVADALARAGLLPGDGYTDKVIFRRCVTCGSRNIVRDGDFACAVCGHELPAHWNFDVIPP